MKGAIASLEVFVAEGAGAERRRLTLTISAPEPAADGDGWICRVVLADLHRPRVCAAPDSVSALAAAVGQARDWLAELSAQGATLFRDRVGEITVDLK